MISFNQLPFIRTAIESALSQKGTFELEVVVCDDASTDGTREVIREIAAQDSRVKATLRPANVGMIANFTDALAQCTGDVVAMLEGDDFWTCPDKIEKQLGAFRQDSATVLSFHRVLNHREDGLEPDYNNPPKAPVGYQFEDLCRHNWIPTCSVMYRRSSIPDPVPDWFRDLSMGDWPMHLLVAQTGKVAFLDEVLGVYRIHPGGVWSGQKAEAKLDGELAMLTKLANIFPAPHGQIFGQTAGRKIYISLMTAIKAKDLSLARRLKQRWTPDVARSVTLAERLKLETRFFRLNKWQAGR